MSDLLPNLDALRGQLTGDAASQQDARALAAAIAHATTVEGVDDALDDLIVAWRQS